MRRAGRGPTFFLGAGLAAISAGYAVWGGIAGAQFTRAGIDAGAARVDEALSRLQGLNWGSEAFETAWLRGSVRLGIWDETYDADAELAAIWKEDLDAEAYASVRWTMLQQSAADFQAAHGLEPGSGRALSGLADAYQRAEYEVDLTRALEISALSGAWDQLGREGRISLGLREIAVKWEPNVSTRHGKLVRGFIEAGCEPEAEVAIARAAHALPCFGEFYGFELDTVSRPLVEAFARGSRDALGTTPLMRRPRHLLCLGQLERALGRPEQALADFETAAAERLGDQDRAEIQFWLGYAAFDLGRHDDAIAAFARAAEYPSFRVGAAMGQAVAYRAKGGFREAFDAVAVARREDPDNPDVLYAYARAAIDAGETADALGALRRAVFVRPDFAAAWTTLVETLFSVGEKDQASRAVDAMEAVLGETDETIRLDELVEGPP